jgi:hypothetical protein
VEKRVRLEEGFRPRHVEREHLHAPEPLCGEERPARPQILEPREDRLVARDLDAHQAAGGVHLQGDADVVVQGIDLARRRLRVGGKHVQVDHAREGIVAPSHDRRRAHLVGQVAAAETHHRALDVGHELGQQPRDAHVIPACPRS